MPYKTKASKVQLEPQAVDCTPATKPARATSSSDTSPEEPAASKRLRDSAETDARQKRRRIVMGTSSARNSRGHRGIEVEEANSETSNDARRLTGANKESNSEELSEELRERLSLHIQRAVIGDEDGDKPIHMAVVYEDGRLVRWLCSLMHTVGAPIDSFNYMRQTPLHLAIAVGNAALVRVLLEEGASPSIRDRHGNTVLHLAVRSGNEDCLTELLRKCSTPESKLLNALDRDGFTPLHVAVLNSRLSMAEDLINAGCNVNAQDGRSGRTPLFYAVKNNDSDMVGLLFSRGASPDIPDYGGMTPLGRPACTSDDNFE